MKLLVIGDRQRTDAYLPKLEVVEKVERVVVARGTPDAEAALAAPDAQFLMADAISPVSAGLIAALPKLRLIHSEGVAYNAIDLAAARERGIPVCNCKGVNATAVAEQAVLLMLALLRDVVNGDAAVRGGSQIQAKERMMVEGIRELADCRIGIVGMGDIGQATARLLRPFGCEMAYHKRKPLPAADEAQLGLKRLPLDSLLASSDVVSLHVPVTAETANMADTAFFAAMKPGAMLINTARGEIVDQLALGEALVSGHLAGAGLDTLNPEPVLPDNSLLQLPSAAAARIVFSPHVGGITRGTFLRAHHMVWSNIARVIAGQEPQNRVA